MDYPLVVEIAHRADQFREDPPQERGAEQFTVRAGNVEQITARAVAEHQDGPGSFYVPGLQVDQGRMADGLHDFQFALEAHFDTVFGRATPRAGFADLDSHQSPALIPCLRFRGKEARRLLRVFVIRGRRRNLAGGQHYSTKGTLAEQFDSSPSASLVVIPAMGFEVLGPPLQDRLGVARGR